MTTSARRFSTNPLATPETVKPSRDDFYVTGVLNAGAFEFDGKFCWLVRVAETPVQDDPARVKIPLMRLDEAGQPVMDFHYFDRSDTTLDFSDKRVVVTPEETFITNISHLRMATSTDGKNWTVEDKPLLEPADKYELFGLEDPRVVFMEGQYLITYSAISRHGVTSNLITTKDFKSFKRYPPLFVPDNKDICIFDRKIDGQYIAMHRPSQSMLGKPDIWLARSDDLIHWGQHECIMQTRPGMWDSQRIGCGPAPIDTDEGWLEIYHGSDDSAYYLGTVLLDKNDPTKILARSSQPILSPEESWEKKGFYPNVVFANGQLVRPGGTVWIYYGGADRVMGGAEITIDELFNSLR